MNKIERLRAVLHGRQVDRVPAGFWFHFPAKYQGGHAMAQRHVQYYREADPDVLKVMNDTGYAPIGTIRVTTPDDWGKIRPTPLSDSLFQSHLEGLKEIVRELGDAVPIMTTAFNPFSLAVSILRSSMDAECTTERARALFVEHARTAPERLLEALGIFAADQARFFRACITDAGASGIYYSAQGAERDLMTDEEHARFVKPFDLQVLGEVGEVAEFVVGHYCGRSLNLERVRDYPVQMANWAPQSDNLSLGEGRMLFGGIAILGGLDERGPLVYGPRDALRSEVETALNQVGTRGFMLGAGCTVPGDVDVGNLVYAREVLAGRSTA